MASSRRGLAPAIGLTVAGLFCMVPVLVPVGPVSLGFFMAGAVLVAAGVNASALLLPRTLRTRPPE